MSPRPYQLGRRKAAADRTRAKVLRAARALLTGKGAERFSLDAVAERAGVARMTVYYQFGSRRGLIEALFDSFAEGGELPEHLAVAFQRPDPLDTLVDVVDAFAKFWDAGRPWIRRVRALGVLDKELGDAVEARNGRRRLVVETVLERMEQRYGRPGAKSRSEVEDLLYTLTSFETFDAIAGPHRRLIDAAPSVLKLAMSAVGGRAAARRRG
jgi:AcrR family transcriptional regulator